MTTPTRPPYSSGLHRPPAASPRRPGLALFFCALFLAVLSLSALVLHIPAQAATPLPDIPREADAIMNQLRSEALEAKAQSASALDNPAWKNALDRSKEGLVVMESEIDSFIKGLPGIARPLKQELPAIAESVRRLLALNESNKENPVLQTTLFMRGVLVEMSLRKQMRPLESMRSMTARMEESLQNLRQGAAASDEHGIAPQTGANQDLPEQRVAAIENKLKRLATTTEKELVPAKRLLDGLTAMREGIVAGLLPLWGAYYLSEPSRIFAPQTWHTLQMDWTQMRFYLPLRLSVELPSAPAAWRSAGLHFINALLLGGLLLLLCRRRLQRAVRENKLQPDMVVSLLSSLAWLFLGLAVVASSFGSYGEQYRGILTVGSIFVIGGETWLAWHFRRWGASLEEHANPLKSLYVTSVLGILLSFPNLPVPILTLCWMTLLIGALVLLIRRKPSAAPSLETAILHTHRFLLWLSLAIAFLGWARLAILLVVLMNCLCVSVQLIFGLLQILNQANDSEQQGTSQQAPGVLSGLISAFIAPIVLLLVIGTTALWVVAMPGGAIFVWHYLGTGVNIGSLSFNPALLFLIISVFYMTRAAIAALHLSLKRWSERSRRVDVSLIPPMQTGITYGLWALFSLFALKALGFGLDNLAVVAGGLSVGIGFGMQAIVNNFLSGLILIFSRTLHEGDVIDVGNLQGTVRKISVRATTVETPDNAIIFVPNSEFVSNRLINWTRNGRHVRRDLAIGVAYGTDPRLVETLILQVAKSMTGIAKYPEPLVLFFDFADSTLNFTLRYWADIASSLSLASEMRHKIVTVFAEHQVEIAFPQLDVHLIPPKEKEPAPAKG